MLVVALADSVVDRLFTLSEVTDILEFRRSLGTTFPALGLVMNIAAHGPGAPQVVVANCPVPIESYGELAVEDFMISLYNDHEVQRLVVRTPGAAELPALAVLSEAVEALRSLWHAPVT